jgi:trigger factor
MTLDASSLTIDLQEGERWRRTLSITVPAAAVTAERSKLVDKYAKQARLPGFRPGKVPKAQVEKLFGGALNRDVLDKVMGDAYKEALRVRDLSPISEGEVSEVKWEPEEDLVFSIAFDVEPTFEVTKISGFEVERPAMKVDAGEVDKVIERLREQNGAWITAEEGQAETGDLVSVTVTRLQDGEASGEGQDYDLLLGEGDAIPGVEESIRTLAPGEDGTFSVTFPDDFPNEERRGQEEQLHIVLRERKIRDLPELNDEFAKSVGEFEDLAALRARVEEDLQKEADQQAEASVRGQLLDLILEANPFEVPGSMVDRYLDSIIGGGGRNIDAEAMAKAKEQLGGEAERAVRRILVLEKLGDAHDLRATDDEVDDRVEEIASANNMDVSRVYGQLQKAGRIEQIEREITEGKIFDFLKEQSTIKDAK